MNRFLSLVALAATIAAVPAATVSVAFVPTYAVAGEGKSKSGPRVKGYTERRGGYSYSQADTINTYGDSRGLYGRANSFRDPNIDRQTNFGPFDHGFFYDSGTEPRGGNSPYLH